MLFSKADGGLEDVVEAPPPPPTPPLDDDLENGLRVKSGIPEDAIDLRLLVSSATIWIQKMGIFVIEERI